jgi:hypothetical protein
MKNLNLMSIEEYFKSRDIEKFIKFLKKRKAYSKFIRNFKNYRVISINEYLMSRIRSYDIIVCAFHWSTTDEGDRFWRNISNHWEIKNLC